jgi:hypothetical protein
MDELLKLVESFLTGQIEAEEFANRFMDFWNTLLEEADQRVDNIPGLRDDLTKLENSFKLRGFWRRFFIAEFERKHKALYEQVPDWEFTPFGRPSEFLSELFTSVENYEPDPEVRIGEAYSDETQLRQEVSAIYEKYK